MRSKAEKRQIECKDSFIMNTGICMGDMDTISVSTSEKVWICFIKGILIFLACFGLNLFVIHSFKLPCSIILLGLFSLFLSMFVSFFYFKRLYFNIGYILLFILFLVMSFFLLRYANSGMNAIVNIIMDAVDDKLHLDGVRYYEEVYENRYLTITCCLFLVMFLEVCFLNSVISEYMSGFVLFLIFFPIIQVCIYLNDKVSFILLGFIMVPVIACMFLRSSRLFRISLRKQELSYRFKKQKITYQSRQLKSANTSMAVAGSVICVAVMIVSVMITQMLPYRYRNNHSAWKNQTDDEVADFAMNGISAYFNSYSTTGGISGGKLGGVRQVNLDFQTDLILDYVPYNTSPLYLKAFVGGRYADNQWFYLNNTSELKASPYYFNDFSKLVNLESNYLKSGYENGEQQRAKAYMHVQNIGADTAYVYYPYYSAFNRNELTYRAGTLDVFNGDIVLAITPKEKEYDVTYYPLLNNNLALSVKAEDKDYENYRTYVYNNYLEVPDYLKKTLSDICNQEQFHGSPMEIVAQLQKYFTKYKYTLSPGKTPGKKDFVLYFLTKQKKGFCAHFASAGALLLRQMGIPTRYVEGYCVDIATVIDSDYLQDENWKDWYDGDNLLDPSENGQVVHVEVNDSKAHCWVEVFIDGFGWVPVELTTGQVDNGEDTEEKGFWANFTEFFTGSDSEVLKNFANTARKVGRNTLLTIITLVLLAVLCLMVIRLFRLYFIYLLRNNKRLSNQFIHLNKVLKHYEITNLGNVYHKQAIAIGSELGLKKEDLCRYIDLVERASYSNERLTVKELNEATRVFSDYIRAIRSRLKWYQKLTMFLKY